MSWPTKTGSSFSKKPLLKLAHRGCEGLWPSNSLFAFERALAMGADVLEMDIHSTADGVLVVRHDPFVESTTDGSGFIRSMQLAELKRLDAGYTWTDDGGQSYPFRSLGIEIPTLEQVFMAFPDARLNIDIKPEEPHVVHQLSAMLEKYQKLDQATVGSFHDKQLALFRRLCPGVRTAAGVSETRWFYYSSRLSLARFYHPLAQVFQIPEFAGRLRVVSPGFVRAAHQQGLEVHVWTVNEKADMRRLIAWDVDGIITDYLDRLAEVLDERLVLA